MNKKIFKKYENDILMRNNLVLVKYNILESFLKDLIIDGYVILGYDGLFISNNGTESPLDLCFDFSRINNINYIEMNNIALTTLENIKVLVKKYSNLNNLYFDVVYKKI